MTFKLHKEYCTGCQSGLFCDEGIALLQNKTPITGETVEKTVVFDSITEMAENLSNDIKSKYVEVDDHKVVKVKTEADRFLTKKQRWRKYKNQIKKDPNKVGLTKFHRN